MSVQTASLTGRLDRVPIGSFHKKLVVLSGLGWMFDAMDIGILAFVVARLSQDWKLGPWEVGWLLSIGGLGMLVGAAFSGWAADRFGRKTVFQWTLLSYSIATGLSALVPDGALWLLMALRFVVGLGVGGELPVASTLVSEFSPAKDRGRLLVLLESFWAYGWILAAVVGLLLIPQFGWRAAFLVGALPAFYVLVLRQGVPESPRFLLSKGRAAEAEAVVRSIEAGSGVASPEGRLVDEPTRPVAGEKTGLAAVWAFPRRTLMLWILWFGITYSYYGIFTWLPSILSGDLVGFTRGFQYVLIITLAQVPGYFSAAYLVERLGRKWTLASYLLGCAISAYLFGQSQSVETVLLFGCLMSFFNLGAWGVVYGYTPEQYPTRLRGTGAGFAAAVGRLGGVLGPLVVPFMLSTMGVARDAIFLMFAICLLIIAANVALLGEETKGQTLEEIAGRAEAESAGASPRERQSMGTAD